jgi:hypothetical protein
MSPENHPIISPVFNHRLYTKAPTPEVNLGLTVLFAAERAKAPLTLLRPYFIDAGGDQLSDSLISRVMESAYSSEICHPVHGNAAT